MYQASRLATPLIDFPRDYGRSLHSNPFEVNGECICGTCHTCMRELRMVDQQFTDRLTNPDLTANSRRIRTKTAPNDD